MGNTNSRFNINSDSLVERGNDESAAQTQRRGIKDLWRHMCCVSCREEQEAHEEHSMTVRTRPQEADIVQVEISSQQVEVANKSGSREQELSTNEPSIIQAIEVPSIQRPNALKPIVPRLELHLVAGTENRSLDSDKGKIPEKEAPLEILEKKDKPFYQQEVKKFIKKYGEFEKLYGISEELKTHNRNEYYLNDFRRLYCQFGEIIRSAVQERENLEDLSELHQKMTTCQEKLDSFPKITKLMRAMDMDWVDKSDMLAVGGFIKSHKALKEFLNVSVVVDLREECDDKAALESHGITLLHRPMAEYREAPSSEFLLAIAKKVDPYLDEGKKVLVHCRAGRGRSPLVASCILAWRGIENAQTQVREKRVGYALSLDQELQALEFERLYGGKKVLEGPLLAQSGSELSLFTMDMFGAEVTPADPEEYEVGSLDPEDGKRKLEKISKLKPEDTAQSNNDCEDEYNKRYFSKVGDRRSNGYYAIETYVRKEPDESNPNEIYPYPCYTGFIHPTEGKIIIDEVFRDVSSSQFRDNISEVPGRYDMHAEFQGTEALDGSKILYNWIRGVEKKSGESFQSKVNAIKICHIINKSFTRMDNYLQSEDGIDFSEIDGKQRCRMVFEKGDDGYYIMMGTSISTPVQFLGVHNLNREVTKIIYDRIEKSSGVYRYNVIYKYDPIDTTNRDKIPDNHSTSEPIG